MATLSSGFGIEPDSQVPYPSPTDLPSQEFMTSFPSTSPPVIIPETSQIFPKVEHVISTLHASSPDVTVPPFLEPMASSQLILPADPSPPFISSLPPPIPAFPAPQPTMNVDEVVSLPPPLPAVPMPPQTQPPSAAIHGVAAAYGAGVTSSLESALEPTTLHTGRSRANTLGSAVTIPLPVSPPEPPAPAYSPESSIIKAEESAPELLASMSSKFFHNLSQTAATRGHSLNSKAQIRDLLVDIQSQLQRFNQLIDGVSDLSLEQGDDPKLTVLGPEFLRQTEDRTRKRCASRMDGERPIKAPKVEPQDEVLPYDGIYGSRPPTPTQNFVFNPVKPQSSPTYSVTNTSTNATFPTTPAFPPLRSSWSDNVLPTRHAHSLSAGSNPAGAPFNKFARSSTSGIVGRMNRSGSLGGSFTHPFQATHATPNAATTQYPAPPTAVWPPTSAKPKISTPPDEEDPDHDEDEEEDSEEFAAQKQSDHPSPSSASPSSSSSDIPQEYRAEVDRIFFEFLNKICCNLEATDSKGEAIHQTLMAKKMQRLDESKDFRPFKFRIAAFTSAFLEELARQGYPEEKIPMKKIRNYLWRQPHILRFNEDGKKAKSKGNHIWNIEAKKAGEGKWEFRPFQRKLAGNPPSVAYCGLRWSWTPRVWDPQASWEKVPVHYSSPNIPSWLSWKDDTLSGIPPPDAQSCDVTVIAKFVLDGQEGQLQHTFHISIAPMTTYDPTYTLPRVASEPLLFQSSRGMSRIATPAPEEVKVMNVLQTVAQNISEVAHYQASTHSPQDPNVKVLAKAQDVVNSSLNAVDKVLSGPANPKTHFLAGLAQGVVAEAAQSVIAETIPANQPNPPDATAIRAVSLHKITEVTQDAIATAVQWAGPASDDVQIINAAKSVIQTRTESVIQTRTAEIQTLQVTQSIPPQFAGNPPTVAFTPNPYPVIAQNYV